MLNAFIQKRELVKIAIIKYLEKSYKQQSTIQSMLSHLNISEYLLETSLDGLREDFISYHLENNLFLTKEDKTITLKKSEKCSTDILYGIYLRESIGFQIMHELFQGSFQDIYQFSERYFVSYANVYRQIRSIKKMLRAKEIILTNDYQLKGDELKIRLYFWKMYMSAYNNTPLPLLDDRKEMSIQTMIQSIEAQTNQTLCKTLANKISCFLGVSLMRIEQDIYLANDDFDLSLVNTSPVFQETFQLLIDITTCYFKDKSSQKYQNNEIAMILAYFISEDILPSNVEDLAFYYKKDAKKQELVQRISASFISALIGEFNLSASSDMIKKLAIELEKLHFKLFCFNQLNHLGVTQMNIDFFKQNYSSNYEFCIKFIKWLKEENHKLFVENSEELFFDYLLLLIAFLPAKAVMQPIKVCVDFSVGAHYDQMIINELKSFQSFHLEITNVLDEEVNLYLSDNIADSEQFSCETIIWGAPPTGTDWKNIGNILVRLKNEKGSEKNERQT